MTHPDLRGPGLHAPVGDTDGARARQRARIRSPELLTHTVMVGLTPIIPVPVLDDLVKTHLERKFVARAARAFGHTLSEDEIRVLADGPGESVMAKLASGALTLPVRLLFRKVFFVLELKRATDAASLSYHRGYLLCWTLAAGVLQRGAVTPALLGAAIERTLEDGRSSPVGQAMHRVFDGSKERLLASGKALYSTVRRLVAPGATSEAEVARAVSVGRRESEREVRSVVERLGHAFGELPVEHFDELERRFENHLGVSLPR